MTKLRLDIQALRGLAVLLVVFYHAKLFSIKSGYLGVDIFFVISGFLITQQIARQVINNSFSFKQFYLRRAWRLLPAAYTVFALSIIAAPFTLSSLELSNFAQQLFGALSFTANFVLYSQSGYFSTAAELKPLLHTWSLSIEEQYYILMPALLVLFSRNYWLTLVIVISFISYIAYVNASANIGFYFSLTRCWELGVGSILALISLNTHRKPPAWLAYVSILILVVIVFSPNDQIFMGLELSLLILATACIIACENKHLNSGLTIDFLAHFGKISYSLYLVHWPIIAIINNLNISNKQLPLWIKISSLVASFIGAYLLHKLVESRYRTYYQRGKIPTGLIISTAILCISSVALLQYKPTEDYAFQMRPNNGFSLQCSETDFHKNKECKNAQAPEMLVWGDSFAMHLVPGLSSSEKGLMQATKTTCLPINNLSFFNPPEFDSSWGKQCIEFNQSVFNFLKSNSHIKTVVMASAWRHLLNLNRQVQYNQEDYLISDLDNTEIANGILATANEIRSLGINVVIVAPPPKTDFDIGRCHEKFSRKQIKIGGTIDCSLVRQKYQNLDKKVFKLIDHLESNGEAVYSFEKHLCSENRCETKLDQIVLYRDRGHLSVAGSEIYGRKFQLYDTLSKHAN